MLCLYLGPCTAWPQIGDQGAPRVLTGKSRPRDLPAESLIHAPLGLLEAGCLWPVLPAPFPGQDRLLVVPAATVPDPTAPASGYPLSYAAAKTTAPGFRGLGCSWMTGTWSCQCPHSPHGGAPGPDQCYAPSMPLLQEESLSWATGCLTDLPCGHGWHARQL